MATRTRTTSIGITAVLLMATATAFAGGATPLRIPTSAKKERTAQVQAADQTITAHRLASAIAQSS